MVRDQHPNIRHDAIPTANHETPLTSPEHSELFAEAISVLQNRDNDNLLRSVAGEALAWDPVEVIKVGHRRQKELVISLEDVVWERRALLWLAVLRLLDHLL